MIFHNQFYFFVYFHVNVSQKIAPLFEELGTKFADRAILVKVDVDENSATSESCGVTCMPTFMFFRNGKKFGDDIKGAPADLEKEIEERIKATS